jgi:ABC-type multidrug transport system fused ATPase/permease subunit
MLFITPLSILIARFVLGHSARMFKSQQMIVGRLNSYAEEMISGQKVIKAYGLEENSYKSFKEINAELYEVGQKAQFYSSLVNPTTRFVNHIAYIAVGIIGGLLAVKGNMSVGKIAAMLTYATQFARPINEITGVTTQLQSAFASAERVFALIDEVPETNNPSADTLNLTDGVVSFNNVSFSYIKDKPLIKNISFSVKADNIIAIVGPTGAGKSTLVNLLMRFYEVDRGKILIDGTDISAVTRDSLRTSFAMVLQDTWLFTGSIRENIAYGKPDASIDEIIRAAKDAHAHNFIKRLANGYDTVISGDGSDLSQGQQQLLTIARAMLINPPMLILDEATSSVDTRTEHYIQQAFDKIMEGRTSFVIAHRLSTIRHADLILVMKDGDIVEQGTHDSLLALKGTYYDLYCKSLTIY